MAGLTTEPFDLVMSFFLFLFTVGKEVKRENGEKRKRDQREMVRV